MRLSAREGDVLACIELQGDLTVPEIRKATGHRDHAIRYALSRLQDRGVIVRRPFINLPALGYTMHNIYFSISSESRRLKQKLVEELAKQNEIVWVAEIGGDYQYALDICALNIREVKVLLNELTARFGNFIFQKAISTQYSSALMPRGYLTAKKLKTQPLMIEPLAQSVSIDELDRRVLVALAKNGDWSHRRLAAALGMPFSSFELRVRRLSEKQVIRGMYYGVDASRYGVQTFKLLIFGKGINLELTKKLFQFCARHPRIVSLYECLGSWDYEVGLEVETPQDVTPITEELYEQFGADISTIKVLSRFRDLKYVMFPGA